MKKEIEFEYLGYTIKNCTNNDGIVLISPKGSHCGNFGDDVQLAKKYALLNYMCDKPKLRATVVSRLAESNSGGHYGDYSSLIDCIQEDGLVLPPDIQMAHDMNRMIDLNKLKTK